MTTTGQNRERGRSDGHSWAKNTARSLPDVERVMASTAPDGFGGDDVLGAAVEIGATNTGATGYRDGFRAGVAEVWAAVKSQVTV
ncbi:hypothetical protein [Frankia canadensis]|uniref:hypothetical protein n=1 Tax=Frankia canadensis TaxID=1836972 RepID=UPI001A9C56AA|nr:hypothetical protein [Frankia canadensis]